MVSGGEKLTDAGANTVTCCLCLVARPLVLRGSRHRQGRQKRLCLRRGREPGVVIPIPYSGTLARNSRGGTARLCSQELGLERSFYPADYL